MGAHCEEIKSLAEDLIRNLSDKMVIGYTDTDHHSFDQPVPQRFLDAGAEMSVSMQGDKIEIGKKQNNDFDVLIQNRSLDLMIVNGNHHIAEHQILIVNESKADSLQRNKAKLTDVKGVFLNGSSEIPSWIKELIPEYTSVYSDTAELAGHILELYGKPAVLKGLILAGGKSLRMGQDKALLQYHGKPQFEQVYELLSPYCESVHLSVAGPNSPGSSIPVIKDKFVGLGPYGGILSAMAQDPDAAWLVMAVDLPGMTTEGVYQLVNERDTRKYATAFHNEETDFPDPLCTIWEPRSYMRMLEFLSMGHSCPRKVLINSDIKVIEPVDPRILDNINTPEERAQFTT